MSEEEENSIGNVDKPILSPPGLMGMSPFLKACFDGDLDLAKELQGKGADINFRKISVEKEGLEGDELENYFLEEQKEAKINHKGYNAVDIAIQQDNIDILKYLVEDLHMSLTETTEGGFYAIHIAAENDSHQSLTYILDECNDRDVNLRGGSNLVTALHIATQNNACGSIQILAKHGANFDAEDANGRKPVDYCNSDDTYTLFVANGAAEEIVEEEEEVREPSPIEEEEEHEPIRLETPEDVRQRELERQEHEKHVQEMIDKLFPWAKVIQEMRDQERYQREQVIQRRKEANAKAALAGKPIKPRTRISKTDLPDTFNNETFMRHVHRQIVTNDGNVNTFLRTHKFDWWYGRDQDGKTALHLVAEKGKAKQFIPLLFSKPVTLLMRDNSGKTAVSYLLGNPPNEDLRRNFSFILQNSEYCDAQMAKEIIEFAEDQEKANRKFYINEMNKLLPKQFKSAREESKYKETLRDKSVRK